MTRIRLPWGEGPPSSAENMGGQATGNHGWRAVSRPMPPPRAKCTHGGRLERGNRTCKRSLESFHQADPLGSRPSAHKDEETTMAQSDKCRSRKSAGLNSHPRKEQNPMNVWTAADSRKQRPTISNCVNLVLLSTGLKGQEPIKPNVWRAITWRAGFLFPFQLTRFQSPIQEGVTRTTAEQHWVLLW